MVASKYDGQEVNTEKMKCIFMSHEQTARQNYNIKIPNESLRNRAKFKYLEATLTNQNCNNKELTSRLKLEHVTNF
jgi:hypothetical protein